MGLGGGIANEVARRGEVFAGGEVGDDAAVFLMEVGLGGDDVGEDVETVGDDGGGGFVAGGFDA